MLEAQRRGHGLHFMEVDDLFVRAAAHTHGRYRRLQLARATPSLHNLANSATGSLADFDTVWMRKDPPFDMQIFLRHPSAQLIDPSKCFHSTTIPKGLREANEKLYAHALSGTHPADAGEQQYGSGCSAFMDELGGELIVKLLDGCGGSGVFYLNEPGPQHQFDSRSGHGQRPAAGDDG